MNTESSAEVTKSTTLPTDNVHALPGTSVTALRLEVGKVFVDVRGESVKIAKGIEANDPTQSFLYKQGYRFLSDAGMAYKPDGTAVTRFCTLYKLQDDKDVPPPATSAASYFRVITELMAEIQRIAAKIDVKVTVTLD